MLFNPFSDNSDWYFKILTEIYKEGNEDFNNLSSLSNFSINDEKLKILNNIENFCKIDEENMNPIFNELGLIFDKEKRIKEITYELLILNSKFMPISLEEEIIAYFQYTMFKNIMFINELQIKTQHRNKVINYEMISNILGATKKENPKVIYALRQFNNKKVEKIHNKLGFKVILWLNECDLFLKVDYDIFVHCLEKTISR